MKVPRFSLRTKLILGFLLPLLPLLVLVLYTYRFESTTWTDGVYKDQRQTAQAIAALTDANFDQAFAFAWAVANDSLVHTLDPSVLDIHLQQLRVFYTQFPGVAVYNAAGDLVGISSPWPADLPRARDAQDVPYLNQVLNTGQPAVSPVIPRRRPLPEEASVAVAVPIRDGAGNTIGVVSVSIPLDALSSQLQSMTISLEQNIILTDPGGTAALITGLPNLSWEQRDLRDFEPVQAARQGKSSQLESLVLPFSDGNRIGAFIPSPKFHWIVGVTERQDVALAPVWRGLRDWLLGLGIVAVLSLSLIGFLSNRLVEPIRYLTTRAQAMGRGDLSPIASIRTGDELEDLGRALNQMAAEIRVREERLGQVQRELEQRANELQATNQELESFTYSVSHDLRTPLASMDGLARLLMEDYAAQFPAEAKQYLGLIQTGIRQMTDLIASLLALSRLGRQALKKQAVNMNALVAEVLETEGQGVQRADLTIDVAALPDAEADPVLLKQVWANLIGNGLKFTRQTPDPHIEIGCQAMEGSERVYYVRDNGVGFDMAQADHLFGVFQRLHAQEEYEGNGVGLAIVARIIVRHGGRVWADAKVGQGATFYFTLS